MAKEGDVYIFGYSCSLFRRGHMTLCLEWILWKLTRYIELIRFVILLLFLQPQPVTSSSSLYLFSTINIHAMPLPSQTEIRKRRCSRERSVGCLLLLYVGWRVEEWRVEMRNNIWWDELNCYSLSWAGRVGRHDGDWSLFVSFRLLLLGWASSSF